MGTPRSEPRRWLQVLIGALGILLVGGFIALAWRLTFVEGFIGELFAMIVGVFSTPIMLEASLIVLGLIVVVAINAIRLKREGDEYVYLEQVSGPEAEHLPEAARAAIFTEKPEAELELSAFDLIEGAIDCGDLAGAGEQLQGLQAEEFDSEQGLVLRLRLAMATGKRESATAAVERLRRLAPDHEVLREWEA